MTPDTLRKLENSIGEIIVVITEDDQRIKTKILNIDSINKNIIAQNINESTDELQNELVNHISDSFEIPFNWIKSII